MHVQSTIHKLCDFGNSACKLSGLIFTFRWTLYNIEVNEKFILKYLNFSFLNNMKYKIKNTISSCERDCKIRKELYILIY